MKVGFNYGAFDKSLKEQANEQGFELQDYDKFEEIRKAINMCYFHVATDAQVRMMINKLHKQILNNLVPIK